MVKTEIIDAQPVFWLMGLAGAFGAGVKSYQKFEGQGFVFAWFGDVFLGFLALGSVGAVVAAILVVISVRLTKPDTVILDTEKLTVTRSNSQAQTFAIHWDALKRIAVDGQNRNATLVAWFQRSRKPAPEWMREHFIERRDDGSFVVYGPGKHSAAKVKADRLRDLLPQYAHSHDPRM